MFFTSYARQEHARLADPYSHEIPQSLNSQSISVCAIVAEVFTHLETNAYAKNIMLINNTFQQVQVDQSPGLIRFIIRNLVYNAIKYTDNGRVEVTCENGGNWLHITVKDSGTGMNEDQVERILKGYATPTPGTCNETGAGIALMIILEFLQQLQGYMTVNSIPSKGTTFKISIPLAYS